LEWGDLTSTSRLRGWGTRFTASAVDGRDRRDPRRGSRAGALTSRMTKALTGQRTPKFWSARFKIHFSPLANQFRHGLFDYMIEKALGLK